MTTQFKAKLQPMSSEAKYLREYLSAYSQQKKEAGMSENGQRFCIVSPLDPIFADALLGTGKFGGGEEVQDKVMAAAHELEAYGYARMFSRPSGNYAQTTKTVNGDGKVIAQQRSSWNQGVDQVSIVLTVDPARVSALVDRLAKISI